MRKVLLIDDTKIFDHATRVARSFDEGIKALEEEQWDLLLLDADLGELKNSIEKNGMRILFWMLPREDKRPKEIELVSRLAAAVEYMGQFIEMELGEYKKISNSHYIKE